MASSKDTKRLGYHKLVYNLESNKFFYDQPGDQFKEVDLSIETEGGSFAGDVLIGGSLPHDPNISLHASGDAHFKGQIDVGFLTTDSGIRLDPDGTISIRGDSLPANTPAIEVLRGGFADGDQHFIVQLDGQVRVGSNAYASPNIILHPDGTGEFHNNITVGDYPQNGALIQDGYGFVGVRNDSGTSTDDAYCFAAFKHGTGFNNANIWFKNDGSAYFAGTVTIGGSGVSSKIEVDHLENTTDSQDPWLTGVNASGASTFELHKDGTITSIGTITSGGQNLPGDATGTTSGVVVEPNGILTINNGGSLASSASAFDIQLAGNSVGSISYEGTATFANSLNIGSEGISGNYNTYINVPIVDDYFIVSKAPGDISTSPIIWGVKEDGSALYRGDLVTQADDTVDAYCKMYSAGYLTIANQTGFGQVFGVYNTTSGSTTARINIDGSASFESIDVNTSLTTGASFISDRTSGHLVSFQAKLNGSSTVEIFAGGSATFGGFVDFVRPAADGEVYVGIGPGGNNEKAQFINSGGEIVLELYDDYSGSANISLNGDGSASFAGGNTSLTANGKAVLISTDTSGTIVDAYAPLGSTGNVFRGWLDSTTTSVIGADGTADFAGKMTCAPTEMTDGDNAVVTKKFFLDNSGGIVGGGNLNLANLTVTDVSTLGNGDFVVSADGSLVSTADATFADGKISLNDNGSAEYEGRILVGDTDITQPASTLDVGVVKGRNASSSAIWEGTILNNASPTSQILADGASSFAGNMEIRNSSTLRIRATNNDAATAIELEDSGAASFAGANANIYSHGGADFFRVGTSGDTVLAVKGGAAASNNDYKVELKNDGSAVFVGDGTFGSPVSSGSTSGVYIQNIGGAAGAAGLHIYQDGVSGEPFIKGYSNSSAGGAKTSKFHINTDGSAEFAGTVQTGVTGTGVQLHNDGTIQSWDNGNLNTSIAADGSIDNAGPISPGDGNAGIALVVVTGESGPCLLGTNKTDINTSRTVNLGAGVQQWNRGYFAGRVQVTNRVEAYAPSAGDYAFSAYGNGSSGASHLFRGATSGGTVVTEILDDGTFKKNKSTGELVCAITDDYLRIYDTPSDLDDFEISLEKDGTASFDGVVTQKGATIKPSNPSGGIYVRNVADDDNVATILGDGSAYFNGSDAPFPTRISKYGSLLVATASDAIGDARCSIDAGNGNITSVGSATFGGNVVSGDTSGSYVQLDKTGVLSVITSNTNTNVIQYGRPSQLPLFSVNTDGGGTFADDVSVGKILSAQDIECYHPSNSLDLMALNYATLRFTDSNGDNIINLNGQTGQARFSALAKVGPDSANVGDDAGATILENGAVHIMDTTSNNSVDLLAGYGAGTKTFHIHSNGSAEFTNEIRMYRSGTASATRINIGGSDTHAVWQNDGNFVIKYDGNCTFAGDGTFGNPVSSGSTSGILLNNTGGTSGAAGLHIYQNGVTDEPFIKGYSNSSEGAAKTPKFLVNTDGQAIFGGDTFYTTDTNFQITRSTAVKLTLNSPGNRSYSMGVNSTGKLILTDESGAAACAIFDSTTKATFYGSVAVGNSTPWVPASAEGVYLDTSGSVQSYRAATGSTTGTYFYGTANGTEHYFVLSNGNVTNTNNSYGAISDIKLKENIVDASSQWDDLKLVRVRNYNYKQGETHTQIGVIAQELETVCPKLITTRTDTDREGNDLGTTTKSVNYSVLYMKAVKALQEAMTRIEDLEARVATLEQVAVLESE